jgi:hypothetical protein
MIIDLPDTKALLKIYISNYIEMLDKNKYPVGKREEVRYCLNKAREKLRKCKK